MFSVSYALRAGGNEGINIGEALAASLEDEPFLHVLCFFDEGSISMASPNHFYCRLWNPTHRLAVISSFSASSTISGTTSSVVHTTQSTLLRMFCSA